MPRGVRNPASPAIYRCREGFATVYDGERVFISPGDLLEAGHPLVTQFLGFFEPAADHVRFRVEQATAAPGELRGDDRTP